MFTLTCFLVSLNIKIKKIIIAAKKEKENRKQKLNHIPFLSFPFLFFSFHFSLIYINFSQFSIGQAEV